MGNSASKGDAYTKTEMDSRYSPIGSSFTKDESDTRYPLKDEIYTREESDNTFQLKGNYALKGDSYTKSEDNTTYASFATKRELGDAVTLVNTTFQPKGNYALSGISYTKGEIDSNFATFATKKELNEATATANNTFQVKGDYALKTDSYTKTESDTRYTPIGTSYTKTESDTQYATFATKKNLDDAATTANNTFQAKGNYALVGTSYTKQESDTTFASKKELTDFNNTLQPKGNYALVGASYTKQESDTTFASKKELTDFNNTLQPKGNYALAGASYTKQESDGRYTPIGTSYTKAEDNTTYATFATKRELGDATTAANTNFATKKEFTDAVQAVGTRIQGLVSTNTLNDIKPNTMWCADGDLCKIPQGKKGIDWGYGASKIYDDAQLKIESDDNIFMRVANDNVTNFTRDNIFVFGSKALQLGQGFDREANAGQISYGRHDGGENGSLNIVGAGKSGEDRLVNVWESLRTTKALGVGDMPRGWTGANFKRRDGRWTHFDWVNDQNNYIRGHTLVDGDLHVNGWSIRTGDGHLRLYYGGDLKYTFHNNGQLYATDNFYSQRWNKWL